MKLLRIKSEKGGTDIEMLITVCIGAVVIGIGYLVMGWVKGVVDERAEERRKYFSGESDIVEEDIERKPEGYTVVF